MIMSEITMLLFTRKNVQNMRYKEKKKRPWVRKDWQLLVYNIVWCSSRHVPWNSNSKLQ